MHNNFSKTKEQLRSGEITPLDLPSSNPISKVKDFKNIDEWAKQILFWRTHLDIFIEDYFSVPGSPVKFEDFQRVKVRAMGNCAIVQDDESRGLGKTWTVGYVLPALCILYPGCKIICVSKNVSQALLTISYIEAAASKSQNLSREIIYPIRNVVDYGEVRFKNGSKIEAVALGVDGSNIRGMRAKVVYVDEGMLIPSLTIEKVIRPILNYKRDIWWALKDEFPEYEDFPSKLIETSSAYLKSCDLYDRGLNIAKSMMRGDRSSFLCCISYKTGVRLGMIDEQKLMVDKASMSKDVFDMEYGCKFIGISKGSFYPYDLVSPRRTLKTVELFQPKNSTSRYVMSVDVAVAETSTADKTVISIVKFNEKQNGIFAKQLVFMRSYKGNTLTMTAAEIRQLLIRFPNIEKIVIDINGVGRGLPSILSDVYVDEENNKEYPPLVLDSTVTGDIGQGIPIIRGYKGDNSMNNSGAIALKRFLENGSLSLPISTADLKGLERKGKKEFLLEETAIYNEADALTVEMGNVKQIVKGEGFRFDTESKKQHKDRYSSLMMACYYIDELEERNKSMKRTTKQDNCLGISASW